MSDQVLVGVCQSSLQSPRKFAQRGLDELSSRDNTLDLREEEGKEGGKECGRMERERERGIEKRKEVGKRGTCNSMNSKFSMFITTVY